jgi:hypothetical protein
MYIPPFHLDSLMPLPYHTPRPSPFQSLATLKHQMIYPIQQHNRPDQDARELEYRDFIPRLRHARQPRCAAFERRAEGGEGFRLLASVLAVVIADDGGVGGMKWLDEGGLEKRVC